MQINLLQHSIKKEYTIIWLVNRGISINLSMITSELFAYLNKINTVSFKLAGNLAKHGYFFMTSNLLPGFYVKERDKRKRAFTVNRIIK